MGNNGQFRRRVARGASFEHGRWNACDACDMCDVVFFPPHIFTLILLRSCGRAGKDGVGIKTFLVYYGT